MVELSHNLSHPLLAIVLKPVISTRDEHKLGCCYPPIMENQMEKNMENDMETRGI